MTDTPLPDAVCVVATIPGLEQHRKGHLIIDAETIRHVFERGSRRCVVAVHRDYAAAHLPADMGEGH